MLDVTGLNLTPAEAANVEASFAMLRPKLFDGERRAVVGRTANYEVLRRGAVVSCTCTAWRMQRLPVQFRTCKHLVALLGAADEDERVREAARAAGRTLPVRTSRGRRS